jgi:hypothetical protein
MLDTNQTSLYTPVTKDTPSTTTITPSLAVDAYSITGPIVQNVWDDHKTSVDTGTAPSDLGVHTENDGRDARMHVLYVREEQPIPSDAADLTNQTEPVDGAHLSAAEHVIPATFSSYEPEDQKIPTSTGIDTCTKDPPVAREVAASTSEPHGIETPSSSNELTKPLRQGYDVTTGTFYYFHEATPPPKPEQVEHENTNGENGQGDVMMNGEEDGEEGRSGEFTDELERSSSPLSTALPGLMRTRRRPRISYAEPYSMRDSESRSPSPTAPTKPKRTYGRRGSRQRSGSDGCPPPTLRGGKISDDFYIPPLPTNIQPVEGIKQMTMEQKTKLAMELGGRPLRKKELVYIMECMDPDLKSTTDRGWVVGNFIHISWCVYPYFSPSQNTLSQGNSVRKSSKSAKGKTELKAQVISLESDYVTGYFWWLPGQL